MAKKSQIKHPLHLATDAQGPMGIMDASGKAVCWFSDCFKPTNGYVWEADNGKLVKDPDSYNGVTAYKQRNDVVRAVLALLNGERKGDQARRRLRAAIKSSQHVRTKAESAAANK